jgi:hypothetical protein
MSNEMKAAFRAGLLVLAVLLTAFAVMYLHDENGNTAFIGSVVNWQNVVWTPTVIEVVVIWVACGFLRLLFRPNKPQL